MFGPDMYGNGFGHVIGAIVGAFLGFFLFLVGVALIFLLVRFLLVATRAAHIYVAKNSPAPAPRSTTPGSGSAGPAYAPHTPPAAAPASPPPTTTTPTTPTSAPPKPRIAKTPPPVVPPAV